MTQIHEHKGMNYFRIFSLTILVGLALFAIFLIYKFGLIYIPFLLGALMGIFSIRFPKIYLYNDRLQILKKCIFNKFTDDYTFKYNEIKSIEFSKGFTDRNYIIVLALFGGSGAGGNSKADQMIIKTLDNSTTVFNRFGKRSDFVKTIDFIKNNIKPATNI